MDIHALTFAHIRWIERCAERIPAADPEIGHMAAVQQAFELFETWPLADPVAAAEAFSARELIVLPA
ncbi:hypothetical protein [Piscinibacter koreensis]|uniref:Uncharacterized protein n=1 Tax=Piscinibacter koreensis TaxID=2742824 RepID=A0A7Y6NQU1_9BURK|nr:hypothetical protein [Schlegelella koreensis]NUZ07618.1 hypothetical protein [Schlegelella koreensis]